MTVVEPRNVVSGTTRFVRYAFMPNRLRYCGGDDNRTILEYAVADTREAPLDRLLRKFTGALPYLALIARRNGIADPGIMEYLTVSSHEPNTRADGTAKISIRNPNALRQLLTDNFGAGRARTILQSPATNALSVLEFYYLSRLSAEDFAKIETELTTTSGAVIPGRVNVNTASAAVLTCIPGIGEDKAAELVSYRLANTGAADTVAWVTKVLTDRNSIRDAGPFLTGQSYQFTADIAAVGKFGRGYRRTKFVFDTTEGTPKIVYRQNLSGLGWALGKEARQTWLATATP